jgi:hypothetical protein
MIEDAKKEIISLVVLATEKILKDEYSKGIDSKIIKKVSKM